MSQRSRRSQHRAQPDGAPYTKVLSALLKPDLLRLCRDLRLPSEGSVVTLRSRLKDYLNLHRNTLYRNQRFTALFPRHSRPAQRQQPPPRAHAQASRSSSPSALSYISLPNSSLAPSDISWHGFGDPQQPNPQPPYQPAAPQMMAHPQSPLPSSPPSSDRGSPSPLPLVHDAGGGRKLPYYFVFLSSYTESFFLKYTRHYAVFISLGTLEISFSFLLDTMKSFFILFQTL